MHDSQFSGAGAQVEAEVAVSSADISEVTGWKWQEMHAYSLLTYIINFLLYGRNFKHRFLTARLVHLDINRT